MLWTSKLFALVAVAAAACGPPRPPEPDYVPAVCEPAMRDWILQCIENANPYSDEEPEDNTEQCERTAVPLFCGTSCFLANSGRILCDPPSE